MAAWWRKFIPTKNDRELSRISLIVDQINGQEAKLKAIPDDVLQSKTSELRNRYLEAFKAAMGPVMGNCKSCHEAYRVKK